MLKSGEWTDVVLYCRNNDLYYQWEGALDLSRIRALYFDFNGLETDIALDSIRLVDVEDLGQGIDMDLDTLGDWSVYSGSIAVDTDSPKQGAGSRNCTVQARRSWLSTSTCPNRPICPACGTIKASACGYGSRMRLK